MMPKIDWKALTDPASAPATVTLWTDFAGDKQAGGGHEIPPGQIAARPDALAAELSRLAYPIDRAALVTRLAALGLGQLRSFDNPESDTQAIAAIDGTGRAWIAFRGTQIDEVKDFLTDAQFPLEPVPGHGDARAHRGFNRAYHHNNATIEMDAAGTVSGEPRLTMQAALARWIGANAAGGLTVTGHSLGAALATLLALDHPQAQLRTFGSPRVGDAAMVALLARRDVRRYHHCCDVVCTLPPRAVGYAATLGFRYIDRTQEVQDWSEGSMHITRDQWAARFEFAGSVIINGELVLVRELADHAIQNYIAALV